MRELITFLVDGQEFCIDVKVVREIRVWTPATPVPHAPGFMCGVINLRGAVLPIIDFAACLGGTPTTPTKRHAILVVEERDRVAGLLVEGVSEILTVRDEAIQAVPDAAADLAQRFVSGIIAIDDRLVSLVTLDAVLPPYQRMSRLKGRGR